MEVYASSPYYKTRAMKYIELKHGDKLENLIFKGTIYEVGKRLDLDASTVSKWRALVSEAQDKEFWKQFAVKK